MGPKWFVNFMRVFAIILVIAVLAFSVFEAIGLMGFGLKTASLFPAPSFICINSSAAFQIF